MTDPSRRRLESRIARLETLLPSELVAIAESDMGILTSRMSEKNRRLVERLRAASRQLAAA